MEVKSTWVSLVTFDRSTNAYNGIRISSYWPRHRIHSWKASLFGPIKPELEEGRPIRITYPRFFQTPDGGLQFCYRQGGSGNGDRVLVDYDAKAGKWTDTRQIDSRKGLFKDSMGVNFRSFFGPNLLLNKGLEPVQN